MNWFKLECTTRAFVTALQLTVRYEMSVIIIIIIIELCLLVAYRGKMHGRKSVQDLVVARGKFSELTGAC